MPKYSGSPTEASPVLDVVQEGNAPGIRVRHEGVTGNAIEVVGSNGSVVWSVGRLGGTGYIDPTSSPYNCVGDSVTDDTVGFLQAAADAASQRRPLVLPPNRQFLLSQPIPLATHLHIWGDPTGNAQLAVNGRPSIKNQTTDMFSISADVTDVQFVGVYFTSGGAAVNIIPAVNSSTGAKIRYSRFLSNGFENCVSAFGGTRVEGCVIADNYIANCSGEGLILYGADTYIDRNFIDVEGLTHTLFAVHLESLSHSWVRGNYITCQPQMGMTLKTCNDVRVEGNIIEAPVGLQIDGAAIYINQSSQIRVEGNYLHRILGSVFAQFSGGITVFDSQEIDLDGNFFDTPISSGSSNGLYRLSQSSTTLSGIRIRGTRRTAMSATLRYVVTSGTLGAGVVVEPLTDVATLTDGATVTPEVTLAPTMTLSAAGSRTIAAPFVFFPGMRFWVEVLNNTAGAITTTWNAAYNFTGVGGWTDPAASKRRFVLFEARDATTLIAVAKASADY